MEGPSQRVIVKYGTALAARDRSAAATQALAEIGSRYGVTLRVLRTTATGADVVVLESLPAV